MHRLWKFLLSLGSNKPGKQTVHGLKCHLEKCHKDIYTLYVRKVESRQQGPPAKKAKLDEVGPIAGAKGWLGDWMYEKFIRWVSFSFFGRKWMSIFVFVSLSAVNAISFCRHFRLRPKMKNAFRSASSIHHKKVLVFVLVLRCKVLVLVLNTRLGLGLGLERILKSWSCLLVLKLKKSLDYITARTTEPRGPKMALRWLDRLTALKTM